MLLWLIYSHCIGWCGHWWSHQGGVHLVAGAELRAVVGLGAVAGPPLITGLHTRGRQPLEAVHLQTLRLGGDRLFSLFSLPGLGSAAAGDLVPSSAV